MSTTPGELATARQIMEQPPAEAAEILLEAYDEKRAYQLVLTLLYEIVEQDPGTDVTGHVEVLHFIDPIYLRLGHASHLLAGFESYCPAGRVSPDGIDDGSDGVRPTALLARPRWIVIDPDRVFADVSSATATTTKDWPWWRIFLNPRGFTDAVIQVVADQFHHRRIYERIPASVEPIE